MNKWFGKWAWLVFTLIAIAGLSINQQPLAYTWYPIAMGLWVAWQIKRWRLQRGS